MGGLRWDEIGKSSSHFDRLDAKVSSRKGRRVRLEVGARCHHELQDCRVEIKCVPSRGMCSFSQGREGSCCAANRSDPPLSMSKP